MRPAIALAVSLVLVGLVPSASHALPRTSHVLPMYFQYSLTYMDVIREYPVPVIYESFRWDPPKEVAVIDHLGPHNLPKTELKPKTTSVKKLDAPITSATSRYIRGYASWYCKAGVSICHHSYPPGSMVAAACGKLRSAIGSGWRGRTVTVTKGSRSVRVKLVDWCGSSSKLIDLYWEPMRRLGGTGVLYVKVSW